MAYQQGLSLQMRQADASVSWSLKSWRVRFSNA